MFGLMRPQNSCSTRKNDVDYLYHRRHYCGTCKAIGQNYNQQSRLMLNFDTVFLSELLSQLESEDLNQWDENLQAVNTCFSMPTEKIPFSLEYAASASVLLGVLKIEDNIQDEHQFQWKLAKRVYASPFQKAIGQFEEWGIDTIYIQDWIQQQNEREQELSIHKNIEDSLVYYAEATAKTTAYIFQQGGLLLNQKADLYQLGYSFGQLMYVLDAFEDYEQDVFSGQFNPLVEPVGKLSSLNGLQLEQVRSILLHIESEIHKSIDALSIGLIEKDIYKSRLSANLALRLYKERVIPKTIKERIHLRWIEAKRFAKQITCQPNSWLRQLNYYVIVLAVFINPQTKTYLPTEGKLQVAGWALFITTVLAGIGITGVIRRNRKEKKAQKRKERRLKRFRRRLKKLFSRQDDCCGDCCSDCCSNCWEDCCSECCSNCCSGFCDFMCQKENLFITLIIIVCTLVLAALIILLLFLLGLL
jgi:hypothetical protein